MTPHTPVGRPLRPRGKLLQEDARRHHRSLLLQLLFREGPASRADLARSSGLTRVTVSDLVGEMLADGYVTELGAPAESRVGKPPTLVGLAADSHHIIGLDLSETDRMSGAVVNLAGTVQARHEVHVDGAEGEQAVELVLALASRLMTMTDRPVLGVDLAMAPTGLVPGPWTERDRPTRSPVTAAPGRPPGWWPARRGGSRTGSAGPPRRRSCRDPRGPPRHPRPGAGPGPAGPRATICRRCR